MLTKRHLAIIRAALQFFDEEMSPHRLDVAHPYFEEPLEEGLAIDEVRQLRELLRTLELRYVRCDRVETTVTNQELLTFEQAQCTLNPSDDHLATVFLTSRR